MATIDALSGAADPVLLLFEQEVHFPRTRGGRTDRCPWAGARSRLLLDELVDDIVAASV